MSRSDPLAPMATYDELYGPDGSLRAESDDLPEGPGAGAAQNEHAPAARPAEVVSSPRALLDEAPGDARHRQRAPVDLDEARIFPIDWKEFWAADLTGHDWCVDPLLPRGRQAGIFSPAGVGKSLLALEIAAAKASGRSVLGQPAQALANVVYFDQEMTADDLRDRLPDLGYGEEVDLSRLRYYQLSSLQPLDTPEGGDVLMAIVERYEPEMVVLDTMAPVVDGDENSADTYRAFYRCTGSRLKAAGVALLRLDHAGKDVSKGQRGSSAKADDLDIVWRLSRNDDRVVLTCTKSRVSFVPKEVSLVRKNDPVLHHDLEPFPLPKGTVEVIDLLNKFGVAMDATAAVAIETLRSAGQGRRKEVVVAALKVRRTGRFPHPGNQAPSVEL